jgi:hypothetical protein
LEAQPAQEERLVRRIFFPEVDCSFIRSFITYLDDYSKDPAAQKGSLAHLACRRDL